MYIHINTRVLIEDLAAGTIDRLRLKTAFDNEKPFLMTSRALLFYVLTLKGNLTMSNFDKVLLLAVDNHVHMYHVIVMHLGLALLNQSYCACKAEKSLLFVETCCVCLMAMAGKFEQVGGRQRKKRFLLKKFISSANRLG